MKKIKMISLVIFTTILLFLVVTLRTGLLELWSKGISAIANNTEKYSDKAGYVLDGSYTIQIDLADIQSNIGKELYNDGKHKIIVDRINIGSVSAGGINIGFRSFGDYSMSGATLISGVHHITNNDLTFSTQMTAQLIAKYKNNQYDGTVSGISGFNYKSGDNFSIDINPEEAIRDKGKVELTITNLYLNTWKKK
ncbi:hypothetical protein M3201_03505 [Paenibacillus motobuensis]|uniref:hypothetical protein n=1 Tax=Paenibacillus TaxID=44249 RepID=UPI00203A5F7D|nr:MULTISPECIES: hypothetical protein [Paenibacillus]MCM3038766.1 hypothetical protein [Paenibacillus lutimineralis]MCM3645870.1 hypothetical protein [Paenibacillus motobuensis]